MQKNQKNQSTLVGITEIVERYIPMSRRKARKFVKRYMDPIWIGNRMYVDRKLLEAMLDGMNGTNFPLDDESERKQK